MIRHNLLPALAHCRRTSIIILCIAVVWGFFPQPAFAHPMGNFSTNRYSRLTLGAEGVELLYIVDMAEIPTHAERNVMDTNGDGAISTDEEQAYLTKVAAFLPAQLALTLNGTPATWSAGERTLRFVPGQADLPTLRMEFAFTSALPAGDDVHMLAYEDRTYAERLGWREIVVVPDDGVALLASDVPQSDLSKMLQSYPVDLLQEPPAVERANVQFQLAVHNADLTNTAGEINTVGESAAVSSIASASWDALLRGEGFTGLISIELGPWAIMLALLAAFGWGAAHALSPGHGKTIVAAYLVGARGTFAHALFLGATTTITHTFGVFVLGVATLVASQYVLPERIYPWLSTISGLLVITIGVSIGWNRLRALLSGEPLDHHHDHAHDHDHSHHHHDHSHDHSHDHAHSHHHHSHIPLDADGSAVTWRGLLALGISGGLLPCPSALVVLLGSIALGRVGLGLLLILMFSLGLATVLTAFGLLLLRAGKWFERIPDSGRYARYLAVASAAFITLVGAGITVRALIDTGIFSALA